jgi:hypothetical protein
MDNGHAEDTTVIVCYRLYWLSIHALEQQLDGIEITSIRHAPQGSGNAVLETLPLGILFPANPRQNGRPCRFVTWPPPGITRDAFFPVGVACHNLTFAVKPSALSRTKEKALASQSELSTNHAQVLRFYSISHQVPRSSEHSGKRISSPCNSAR